MKICPKCKVKGFYGHQYCWDDGSKLVDKPDPKCPKCGKTKFGKYCAYCEEI